VELEEKEREDELHAFQSGEEKARDASEGLALEQLWILFHQRTEFVSAESAVEAAEKDVTTDERKLDRTKEREERGTEALRQSPHLFCTHRRKSAAPTDFIRRLI